MQMTEGVKCDTPGGWEREDTTQQMDGRQVRYDTTDGWEREGQIRHSRWMGERRSDTTQQMDGREQVRYDTADGWEREKVKNDTADG